MTRSALIVGAGEYVQMPRALDTDARAFTRIYFALLPDDERAAARMLLDKQ